MPLTEHEQIRLGYKVKQWISDPDFPKIMKSIQDSYAIRILEEEDDDKRRDLHHEYRAMQRFHGQLQSFVMAAKLDEKDKGDV